MRMAMQSRAPAGPSYGCSRGRRGRAGRARGPGRAKDAYGGRRGGGSSPADDFPGGWQAGGGVSLARQFERDLHPQLDRYRAGLDALDAEGQAGAGLRFAELDAADQDALLRRVEAGAVTVAW